MYTMWVCLNLSLLFCKAQTFIMMRRSAALTSHQWSCIHAETIVVRQSDSSFNTSETMKNINMGSEMHMVLIILTCFSQTSPSMLCMVFTVQSSPVHGAAHLHDVAAADFHTTNKISESNISPAGSHQLHHVFTVQRSSSCWMVLHSKSDLSNTVTSFMYSLQGCLSFWPLWLLKWLDELKKGHV